MGYEEPATREQIAVGILVKGLLPEENIFSGKYRNSQFGFVGIRF